MLRRTYHAASPLPSSAAKAPWRATSSSTSFSAGTAATHSGSHSLGVTKHQLFDEYLRASRDPWFLDECLTYF